MRPNFSIEPRRVAPIDPEVVEKGYDPMLSMLALNQSVKSERSMYQDVAPVGAKDIDDTEGMRRAVHAINNYFNVLGIFRDDFDRAENDRLARNAYYALCEKASLDYMSTMDYDILDKKGDSVDTAVEFFNKPNPQESFPTILKMVVRDLIRYDQGIIVKTFNHAGYLTEMKAYLGPEFWVETDRVLMDMTGQFGVNFQGFWTHGYVKRWWQRSVMGVYIPFHPEEVCRFMMYPRSDGIYGTDFLKFLRYQIQYLIDSTRAAGKTFENGIVPSIVWEHPDIMTFQQLQQRIVEAKGNNQGSYKFGDILHLVNNEKVSTVSNTLIDMQWLEGQKFVAQLIWSMWGFSASEFIADDTNRATAYVKRNITKSRMLQPILRHIEMQMNREVLPFLKGYKKDWKFKFVTDLDLDDELKKAQIGSTRATTFTTYRGIGLKPSIAIKLSEIGDALTPEEIEDLDEIIEVQDMLAMGGMPEDMDDVEMNRYGEGSEGYSPVNLSDYGMGGEQTEQRMGEKEEKEFSKADPETTVKKGVKYIKDPASAPKGASIRRGSRGGLYYYTGERGKGSGDDVSSSTSTPDGGDTRKKRSRGWSVDGAGGRDDEKSSSSDSSDASGSTGTTTPGASTFVKVDGDGAGVIVGVNENGIQVLTLPGEESESLLGEIAKCVRSRGNVASPSLWLHCARRVGQAKGLHVLSNL